ncbi:15370_t:CDS:2 [Racocetra persica]|uniref:15370_t:CDS:1 n=1 Tax=Racocetra persica TaxID=160502 RepID=A0ACA9QG26_9GLOM|nr:15370_t:CDS:2 [Racocetra persica]
MTYFIESFLNVPYYSQDWQTIRRYTSISKHSNDYRSNMASLRISFGPYMTCLIVLLGHLIFFFNFFGDKVWFIELLGYMALGIESTLPMPQALQNYKNQSVSGFSENSPLQFALCSAVQLLVDSIIVVQFIAYDDKNDKK